MNLLLSVVVVSLLAAPAGSEASPPKLPVLIIDGQNNHNWKATTPILKQALESSGRFSVDVATSPPKGSPEQMAKFRPEIEKYAAVVLNYNGQAWSPEFQKALETYVGTGKGGLVIVHAANNSFTDWGEYNKMIAMGWRNNSFGDRLITDDAGEPKRIAKGTGPGAGHGSKHPFQVTLRDPEHPIVKGMPKVWMHTSDELYHGMRGPIENVHLIATAYSDKAKGGTGEHEPMIWTVTYGQGRVFHTPMGHDTEAMRCVGFFATLQRGTEWAATGKVTLPLPDGFPTAEKASPVPETK